MPESPEVQALAEELGERLTGRALTDVDVVEFRTTKTRARPPESLVGERVDRRGPARQARRPLVRRGAHLVVSLGRHGWARWASVDGDAGQRRMPPPTTRRPRSSCSRSTTDPSSNSPMRATGCRSDAGSSTIPAEVPAVAKLGPDPADPAFSRADFDRAVVGRRKQVKAVLQDQESLAGIGNAYSDEILLAAKLSPVGHAAALTAGRARPPLRGHGRRHHGAIDARSEACRSARSRRRRSRPCACTVAPARPARSAATRSATSRSRARRRSTARPARPAVLLPLRSQE